MSVVLPTRDRWPLLSRALAAALGQLGVEVEVVVVDDGSSDETPARLAAMEDPRVVVLRNEAGTGVARARNRGIEAAAGEWIAFLDDDDIWAPRKLRAQLDAAARTGAALVYGTTLAVDGRAKPLRLMPLPDPSGLRLELLRTNRVGGPSSVMVRASALRQTGGFDERLSALADWDLWLRLSRVARAAACTEPVVAYVEHGENMLVVDAGRVMPEFQYLAAKHAEAARSEGVDFGHLWLSGWKASRHRREGRRIPAARAYLRRARAERSPRYAARAAAALLGERGQRAAGRAAAARVIDPDWLVRHRQEPVA